MFIDRLIHQVGLRCICCCKCGLLHIISRLL